MKNIFFLITYFFIIVGCGAQSHEDLIAENSTVDTTKIIFPNSSQARKSQIISTIFSRYHYKKVQLNDSISISIYNNFVNALDYNKLYFLKEDIDNFEAFKYKLDDAIISGEVNPFYAIFNLYKKRVGERVEHAIKTLEGGFDFTIDETFIPDRKDAEYAGSIDELNELWRKRLKNDALNLKLSGKENDAIVETLSNRYKRFHKTILQYKSEDVFQLSMNAYAESIDPHSNYFSPITSENFKINMSLSFEGIGAQLTNENDYTKIANIIPGGPAFKSGLLKENDKIIGVGQGEEGEIVDVIGWRIDDVVQLIRGDKGTIVKLLIKPAEATEGMANDTILITRDKVKLEEQAASKEIFNLENQGTNYKIGVIDVPAFYVDFDAKRKGDPNYKSTTRDVKKLLSQLDSAGVNGIIIDLRNDGGGSLQEAVELTGLFIKDGPVVQVKSSNGSIEVDEDEDEAIYYDGPLTVLTNRFSASASEIFSGAIQDYGRGIIIGETTYGKGTVQNLIDLDRYIPGDDKLGQVKLTIAKFYRITGSSTQHMGVIPDIEYPSAFPADEVGESSKPTALKWDQIRATKFSKFDQLQSLVPELYKRHTERIKTDPEFQFYLEDVETVIKNREKKEYSLNEEIRMAERKKDEERKKLRDEVRQKETKITISGNDEVKTEKKTLDDPQLKEAGYILTDLIKLKIG